MRSLNCSNLCIALRPNRYFKVKLNRILYGKTRYVALETAKERRKAPKNVNSTLCYSKLFWLRALDWDHTIRFFAQFVRIKNFGPITSRRYFFEKLLARRKHLVFSAKKLLKVSHVFFRCKNICAVVKEFLRNLSPRRLYYTLCRFIVISRSPKCYEQVHKGEKLQLLVINTVATRVKIFFDRSAMKWNRKMENVKITLLAWDSLAYSVDFFMLYHLSPIKFA